MSTRAEDPAGYARRKRYHMNRALVKRSYNAPSRVAADRMASEALWELAIREIVAIESHLSEGVDVEALGSAKNVIACVLELKLRGTQLFL